jgi:hypothetical protein
VYTRATASRWKGLALSATPIYPSTILWECKETEHHRTSTDMNKKQWINGKKAMEKMIEEKTMVTYAFLI